MNRKQVRYSFIIALMMICLMCTNANSSETDADLRRVLYLLGSEQALDANTVRHFSHDVLPEIFTEFHNTSSEEYSELFVSIIYPLAKELMDAQYPEIYDHYDLMVMLDESMNVFLEKKTDILNTLLSSLQHELQSLPAEEVHALFQQYCAFLWNDEDLQKSLQFLDSPVGQKLHSLWEREHVTGLSRLFLSQREGEEWTQQAGARHQFSPQEIADMLAFFQLAIAKKFDDPEANIIAGAAFGIKLAQHEPPIVTNVVQSCSSFIPIFKQRITTRLSQEKKIELAGKKRKLTEFIAKFNDLFWSKIFPFIMIMIWLIKKGIKSVRPIQREKQNELQRSDISDKS